MAIVVGGVVLGVWELGLLACAGITALLLASPEGQKLSKEAAKDIADALEKLSPQPEPEPEPTIPPPVPLGAPVQPCPKNKEDKEECPPCEPPVGTVAYEVHRCPPGSPHYPCTEDHVHFFLRQQSPKSRGCVCFWKRNFRPVQCLSHGETFVPEPGMVPI